MKYLGIKRKVRLFSCFISVLLIGSMVTALDTAPAYASTVRYKGIDASVKTVDLNSVQLSWKPRKGVVKWKVQIGNPMKPEAADMTMKGTFHTIASLKKNITKYTVRNLTTNRYYNFRILGYTKRKGKLVLTYRTYSAQLLGLAGLSEAYFAFDDGNDYYFTATEILLRISYLREYGIAPDYIQLYRKDVDDPGSKYQELAVIASPQNYTDKSVEPGKTYRYKVRGYKVVNGKRVYSEFSRTETIPAVNQYGIYSLKKISSSDKKHTLEVKLTSDEKYNMDFKLIPDRHGFYLFFENTPYHDHPLQLLSYSTDGISWADVDPSKMNIILKGGESIYLKLKNPDGNKVKISDATGVYIEMIYGYASESFITIPFDGSGETDRHL